MIKITNFLNIETQVLNNDANFLLSRDLGKCTLSSSKEMISIEYHIHKNLVQYLGNQQRVLSKTSKNLKAFGVMSCQFIVANGSSFIFSKKELYYSETEVRYSKNITVSCFFKRILERKNKFKDRKHC